MLSPLAIATWISFCIPWAEPKLAAALAHAGSEGTPYLVSYVSGQVITGKTIGEILAHLRTQKVTEERYVGLLQIPQTSLNAMRIDAQEAVTTCRNLEIGYSLYAKAYERAQATEKSPWKTTALAFNYFRSGKKVADTPYSQKAVEYLRNSPLIEPAPLNSPLRYAIVATWSAELAIGQRGYEGSTTTSLLTESRLIADWARKQN